VTAGWSSCTVDLPNPEQWLPIDLGPRAPEDWAVTAAARAMGAGAPPEFVAAMAEDLAWYRAVAANRRAVVAAGYRTGALEPVIAFLHVAGFEAPEGGGVVAELERMFRSPRPYVLGPTQVSTVRLAAGTAVRVRELAGSPADSTSAEVMEYVTHYVVPEGIGGTVIEVTLTWGSLALGTEFSQLADAVAGSLAVTATG
jgi:hypothetical protein